MRSLKALKKQREILTSDKRNNQTNNPVFRRWLKLMNNQFTEKEILMLLTQMKRYSTSFIKHVI